MHRIVIILKLVTCIILSIICIYSCIYFIIECILSFGYQSISTNTQYLLQGIITHFTGGLCCIYTLKKLLGYVKATFIYKDPPYKT